MIDILLRLFGFVLLAGGALNGAVGASEFGGMSEATGALGISQALQFRIDIVDAGLLLASGLLCFGMAAVLSVTTGSWERARDPYDDHPKMAREVAQAMRLPDPHGEPWVAD
jgi:hypothetical protein